MTSAYQAGNVTYLLTLMLLALARLFPIILLAPFFGAKVLPHPCKVAFAICLVIIFLPLLLKVTTTPLGFNMWLIFLILKEFFVGYIIGLLIALPFFIVQNAGMFIDHQRGGASLMINDPTVQNQSSPIGTLFNMMFIVLFFATDGPFLFINAISSSYEVMPPDRLINPAFFSAESPFWQMSIKLFNKVMVMSIQLASPGLIAILMTDVFLGIVNRLAPQIQITFLGLPIKSLLALAVIYAGWSYFLEQVSEEGYSYLALVRQFIQYLGIGYPAPQT